MKTLQFAPKHVFLAFDQMSELPHASAAEMRISVMTMPKARRYSNNYSSRLCMDAHLEGMANDTLSESAKGLICVKHFMRKLIVHWFLLVLVKVPRTFLHDILWSTLEHEDTLVRVFGDAGHVECPFVLRVEWDGENRRKRCSDVIDVTDLVAEA